MRLTSATLTNYRMHRSLEVRFDPSRTVIGGPNESGKSTLVEAIHRALFVHHRSTVGIDQITPRHVSAAPEVILAFEAGGMAYVLRKVFKGGQGSVATLTDATGRRVDGDEAEELLRRLVDVEELAAQRRREQWSHLWVWQGQARDNPASQEVLRAAAAKLHGRLSALAGGMPETDRDRAAYTRVVAEDKVTYSERNVLNRASALGRAKAELDTARAAATSAAAQFRELEDAAATMLESEARIRSLRETQRAAEADLTTARAQLERITTLEQDLVRQQQARDVAVAAYAALADGEAQIVALMRQLDALRSELAPGENALAALHAEELRFQDAAAAAATALVRAVEGQQEVVAEREFAAALAQAASLEAECAALGEQQARIDALAAEIDRLDETLRNLPRVDEEAYAELDDLDRQLQVQRSTLAAIATRVEVVRAIEPVTVAGQPLAVGMHETLTEPAELLVGDGTAIRITPGGGQSLADLRVTVADLQGTLAARLAALGVADPAAARRALDERTAAEGVRAQHLRTIETLGGERTAARLGEARRNLADLEADISRRTPPGFQRPADAESREALRNSIDERHNAALRQVQEAQETNERARLVASDTARQRQDAATALEARRRGVQTLEAQKSSQEAIHGIDRQARLETLAAEKNRAEGVVEETERALAGLRPETVRNDVTRLERAIEIGRQETSTAVQRHAEARGRLRQAGVVDVHATKAAADVRLEVAVRRHAELELRARAVRRLRQLFEARQQSRAESLAKPLRTKVAEYLDVLYGPGSRVSVTVAPNQLADLKVSRPTAGGLEFKFDVLSDGTREQVAAACRLAMAEILAGGSADPAADRCLPLIFDDAFVNSDPQRIGDVQRLLDLGAARGLQIIVLSCNPAEYRLLGAAPVELRPPDFVAVPGPATTAITEADEPADSDPPAASPATTTGQVPVGDDETLGGILLATIGAMSDRSAGNKALREQLGWDETTYERIRDQLVDAGRLERGRGRGGSVRLPEGGGA